MPQAELILHSLRPIQSFSRQLYGAQAKTTCHGVLLCPPSPWNVLPLIHPYWHLSLPLAPWDPRQAQNVEKQSAYMQIYPLWSSALTKPVLLVLLQLFQLSLRLFFLSCLLLPQQHFSRWTQYPGQYRQFSSEASALFQNQQPPSLQVTTVVPACQTFLQPLVQPHSGCSGHFHWQHSTLSRPRTQFVSSWRTALPPWTSSLTTPKAKFLCDL